MSTRICSFNFTAPRHNLTLLQVCEPYRGDNVHMSSYTQLTAPHVRHSDILQRQDDLSCACHRH